MLKNNSEQAFDNALDRVGVMAISGSLNQDDLDAVTTAHQQAITAAEERGSQKGAHGQFKATEGTLKHEIRKAEVALLDKLKEQSWLLHAEAGDVVAIEDIDAELKKRGAL